MKHAVKIIFVDIDWTILDHSEGKRRFDLESIECLKNIQKQGIKVIICTARPYHSVKQVGLFELFTPNGLIAANGALIIYEGKVIHQNIFDRKKFESLCELVLSLGLTMEATTTYDRFLIAPKNDYVDYLYATYYEDTPPVEDYHNREIITAMLFAPQEYDEKMNVGLPEGVSYFRYDTYGVDIFDTPHYKGEGVKKVLEYLGLTKEDTMSFGDDYGDISMFEETKYCIAMENGREELKNMAYYVTEPVWESGVKKAIEKFELLEK